MEEPSGAAYPSTIIELYDEEAISNVLAIAEFRPANAVYIGSRKLKKKKVKEPIINCLHTLGLDTKCFFYTTDMQSLGAITEELEKILDKFNGDCGVDITGGGDVALVAIGMLAKERNLSLFRYDRADRCYRSIRGCPEPTAASDLRMNIRALLELSGATFKGHGHFNLEALTPGVKEDVTAIWSVYRKFHRIWPRAVAYFQQVSKASGDALEVKADAVIFSGERIVNADASVMRALSEAKLIEDYEQTPAGVRFVYKNDLVKTCLCDAGVTLELYVFSEAASCGEFDDVQLSVVIDWDGDLDAKINTINEIDVMAVRGTVPLFISCKSGSPTVVALNEIKTLARQFGGSFAKPVLATMSDVRTRDPYLFQRAADMGVTIIDYDELIGDRLDKRLIGIAKVLS